MEASRRAGREKCTSYVCPEMDLPCFRNSRSRMFVLQIAAILLLFLSLVSQAQSATNSPTETCVLVFEAKTANDVFNDSCVPITFTSQTFCGALTLFQQINPNGNCEDYYQCSGKIVYRCPCPSGTGTHNSDGTCSVDHFLKNCTCPNGSLTKTQPQAKAPGPNNTGLIVGVVVGVLVIVILVIIIVLLVKRKQQQRARPMTPAMLQEDTSRSCEYEDIKYLKNREENVYDNPPVFDQAEYDNTVIDRDAVRPREKSATIASQASTIASAPPDLPGGHPSSVVVVDNDDTVQSEPIYIDALE